MALGNEWFETEGFFAYGNNYQSYIINAVYRNNVQYILFLTSIRLYVCFVYSVEFEGYLLYFMYTVAWTQYVSVSRKIVRSFPASVFVWWMYKHIMQYFIFLAAGYLTC